MRTEGLKIEASQRVAATASAVVASLMAKIGECVEDVVEQAFDAVDIKGIAEDEVRGLREELEDVVCSS